ncbi:hypothetical protein IFM89_004162 [Coptis chinensis]|uniref:NAC domain-containing protein n=1 Tax=Coptis chinensis TaxID=261450 RepID=A0A835H1U9_9MAGN|nr:hypothetical protein IFM89_004162 [Coptis chinensis]
MNEKHESDNIDEIMLPGFRFHPTDQELVGFYLKRKVQQKPLSIELIKQLDIYKYDPWDLPKELATAGEKEWYFYCPRDRKYRNSARPNRVTRAGFWKATGTDRPVYSSDGSRCIGLKKSLVFYQGRASKGMKTDWMMHEFRLPSLTNSTTSNRSIDKSLPANDAWAICRIFKKTNSTAQRALSHSWISSLPETTIPNTPTTNTTEVSSSNQVSSHKIDINKSNIYSFPPMDLPINPTVSMPSLLSTMNADLPPGFMFSILGTSPALLGDNNKAFNNTSFAGMQQQCGAFSINSQIEIQDNTHIGEEETWFNNLHDFHNPWENNLGSVEFPSTLYDEWSPNFLWDSPSTEVSIEYSSNR